MSIIIGTKEYAKDNLVFFMDAANPASVPALPLVNGSAWADISPNRSSSSYFDTYGAGIQYSNDSGGLIFFDNNTNGSVVLGPTGYAYSSFEPSLLGTTLTIEVTIRSYGTGYGEQNLIQLGNRYYFVMDNIGTPTESVGFTTGDANSLYLTYLDEGIDPFSGWVHMVIVVNGTGLYADYYQNKIYLNGVQATLYPLNGIYLTGSNGRIAFDASYEMSWAFRQNGVIHGTPTAIGNRLSKFDLGVLRIYNGELTQEQITQNFESLRGRYGI